MPRRMLIFSLMIWVAMLVVLPRAQAESGISSGPFHSTLYFNSLDCPISLELVRGLKAQNIKIVDVFEVLKSGKTPSAEFAWSLRAAGSWSWSTPETLEHFIIECSCELLQRADNFLKLEKALSSRLLTDYASLLQKSSIGVSVLLLGRVHSEFLQTWLVREPEGVLLAQGSRLPAFFTTQPAHSLVAPLQTLLGRLQSGVRRGHDEFQFSLIEEVRL